jgi:hypothetical protein
LRSILLIGLADGARVVGVDVDVVQEVVEVHLGRLDDAVAVEVVQP